MCSNAPVRTVTPDVIVTHWSTEDYCGVTREARPTDPASKGGAGPTAFYSKAVGAVLIEGSEPRVYRGAASCSGFGILFAPLALN
jgi:hypothetical protein